MGGRAPLVGPSEIGRRLKVMRTERGRTAKEVAAAAEIHPTTLSRIESGREAPKWQTIQRIVVDGLDAELSDLA